MTYHPISTFMRARIGDTLAGSTRQGASGLQQLLLDGRQLLLNSQYAKQPSPDGLAPVFISDETLIGNALPAQVLGNDILYCQYIRKPLDRAMPGAKGPAVLTYHVRNPKHYDAVDLEARGHALSLGGKPNHVMTAPCLYYNHVINLAEPLKASARSELRTIDLNRDYLDQKNLCVKITGCSYAWPDTSTNKFLLDASQRKDWLDSTQTPSLYNLFKNGIASICHAYYPMLITAEKNERDLHDHLLQSTRTY